MRGAALRALLDARGLALGAAPIWGDDFPDAGPVDRTTWRFEDMVAEGQHRVGNGGRPAWRHGARYDQAHDELARRADGVLEMRSRALAQPNPHRRNVRFGDRVLRYGDFTPLTSWLDTCGREYVEALGRHRRTGPGVVFGPGSLIEARVDLSGMSASGARASLWLMPDPELEANAYDDVARTGAEIDIFEWSCEMPHLLQCKVIYGKNGESTPGGSVDLRPFGIDLTRGWHTIALLWLPDRLVWLVDGIVVLVDAANVPQVEQYLILSQELCGGAKIDAAAHELQADPPLLPHEPGLYARPLDLEALDEHVVRIDYVRAHEIGPRPKGRPAADLAGQRRAWLARAREALLKRMARARRRRQARRSRATS